MSDMPTPRTDAASWVETNRANAVVLASFARQLERELAEARAEVARLRGKKMLVSVNTGATTTISGDAMICPDCGTALLHQALAAKEKTK